MTISICGQRLAVTEARGLRWTGALSSLLLLPFVCHGRLVRLYALPGSLPAHPSSLPALPGRLPVLPGSLPALPGSLPAHTCMYMRACIHVHTCTCIYVHVFGPFHNGLVRVTDQDMHILDSHWFYVPVTLTMYPTSGYM